MHGPFPWHRHATSPRASVLSSCDQREIDQYYVQRMEPSQQLQMASRSPEGEGVQGSAATPLTAPRVRHSTMQPLSDALAQEINSYLKLGYTNKMLEDATNLDRIHLRKLRRNWVTTGSVVVHKEPPGRPKKLQPEHEKVFYKAAQFGILLNSLG